MPVVQPNVDRSTTRLATVQEAAELGNHGGGRQKPYKTRDPREGEGRGRYHLCVVLEYGRRPVIDESDARTLIQSHLDSLKSENEFLRRELEPKDHLLAAALERVPGEVGRRFGKETPPHRTQRCTENDPFRNSPSPYSYPGAHSPLYEFKGQRPYEHSYSGFHNH